MTDYDTGEQLFIDLWSDYKNMEEIKNRDTINIFLSKLINRSKRNVVLDHYSQINFDKISKVESIGDYTAIHKEDFNHLRLKYKNESLTLVESLIWGEFRYATYQYFLFNIEKLKIIKIENRIFILIKSYLIPQREIYKSIKRKYNLIEKEENTDELYTSYIFLEEPEEDFKKHLCYVGNLPYYSAVIQAKENIPSTQFSKNLLLIENIKEVYYRLERLRSKLEKTDEYNNDELFALGNTIRRILEYLLKYYCVIKELKLEKLDIEQKYGHIKLGSLRETVKKEIYIDKKIIITANELSHDSGIIFTKNDIEEFYNDVKKVVDEIYSLIEFEIK